MKMNESDQCKNVKVVTTISIILMAVVLLRCDRNDPAFRPANDMSERTVANLEKVIRIRSMYVGDFHPKEGSELLVDGVITAYILNPSSGEILAKFPLPETCGQLQPVWYEKNHTWILVSRGHASDDVGVLNMSGEWLWRYHPEWSPHSRDMVGGDLDLDGVPEFYVSTTRMGLQCLDINGNMIWQKGEGEVTRTDIFYPGGNGNPLIMAQTQSAIELRNAKGDLVDSMPFGGSIPLQVCEWPARDAFVTYGDGIEVFSLKSRVLAKFSLKDSPSGIFDLQSACIHAPNGKHYLAVGVSYGAVTRSGAIAVLSPEGSVLFQRKIIRGPGVCTVPLSDGTDDRIYFGDGDKVIELTMTEWK